MSAASVAPAHPTRAVIRGLLEQHFEDLDFLWELREQRIFAIDWDLEDLAAHEARAEAHLDALYLAGPQSLELARAHLHGNAPFAAAAAAFVLIDAQDPELLREVGDALIKAPEPALEGLRLALRHCKLDGGLLEPLLALAMQGEPVRRAAACDVLAFQRRAPLDGFGALLEAQSSDVRRHGFASSARLGTAPTVAQFEAALADPDPRLRRQALESAARTRMPGLVERCRAALREAGDARFERVEWLGIVGASSDADALLDCTGGNNPALANAALRAVGALGATASVPPLLDLLEHPVYALEAARALARITGLRGFGEDLEPDPDEPGADGPRPDAEAARRQWAARATDEAPERVQLGLDVSAPLGAVFAKLPLAVRRDLYFGACARNGQAPVPDLELERRAPLQALPASPRTLNRAGR
jgi:uncharacterized protein (TIGR02270 family)